MPKYIRLYGARRTGTTWARELFKKNFQDTLVFNNEFGSKHQLPKPLDELIKWMDTKAPPKRDRFASILDDIESGNKMKPFVIIKNPYSWHNSIKRWWSEKFKLESQYKAYNRVYSTWKDMAQGDYDGLYDDPFLLKYESLLANPEKEVEEVASFFDIKMNEKFINPKKIDCSRGSTEKFRKVYSKGPCHGLGKDLIVKITDLVDWELMDFYGYKPMEGY